MHILNTITHKTIWGGDRLTPFSEIKSNEIGHLYSLISNGDFESKIINGKYKGQLFKYYFNENKSRFCLDNYKIFPFIISLTDASDSLSIQVHPDDKTARKFLNLPHGKNESWYFIEAPKSGKIYNGCKVNSIRDLQQKIDEKKFDDIIDYLDVRTGDYVYVQAGTLHALSAGSLVYEIEENCNVTYRLYDFDRTDEKGNKRPLQIQEAVRSINVNLKSKSEEYNNEKIERLYSTKLCKNKSEYKNTSKTIEFLTIINGCYNIENCEVKRGVTIILEPNDKIEFTNMDFIVAKPVLKEKKNEH